MRLIEIPVENPVNIKNITIYTGISIHVYQGVVKSMRFIITCNKCTLVVVI